MNWEEVSKAKVSCEPPDVSAADLTFGKIEPSGYQFFREWNGNAMIHKERFQPTGEGQCYAGDAFFPFVNPLLEVS